ncbi:MAG: VWA domain-containing protein [Candidatus Kapabacteria bacterium]|nr:VWA domain-containing protein [Candidatus Kapabacteria bacterium]
MNLLNPFALFGLAAAGIPLLLHLLNLRKLRIVEFGSIRFLLELQQKQVRRLKLQQILLLILRTLIIVFAVLALSRPTIETTLPVLSSAARASVLILIDNSASMEAADGRGPRIDQAKKVAREIINGLRDGDEVVVLPMVGGDVQRRVDMTRTFDAARRQVDLVTVADGTASIVESVRRVRPLLDGALHAHREIYVISDAQRSLAYRQADDTLRALERDATVFLVRIGQGQLGLETNISVDSVATVTKLLQPDRPIEFEAIVRNGSSRDVTGAVVSLSFNGMRVAQKAIDLPANGSRTILLSATPNRQGAIAAAVELESDAVDGDNVRWAGVTIPRRARLCLVGPSERTQLVRTVLALPGVGSAVGAISSFETITAASSAMTDIDVLIFCGTTASNADASVLRQFLESGGGAILFASASAGTLLPQCGLQPLPERTTTADAPFVITAVERTHPLYQGVFRSSAALLAGSEGVRVTRQTPAGGGFDIVRSGAGGLVSEATVGQGRVIYIAVPPDMSSGTFPVSGLFAATLVRSTLYVVAPRDQGVNLGLGESVSIPIPPRLAGRDAFIVADQNGVSSTIQPIRMSTATLLPIPAQFTSGVTVVSTRDSVPVTTVTVNGSTNESRLDFFEEGAWKPAVDTLVVRPDHVTELSAGTSVQAAIREARTGSELWPLATMLALACALAEMLVARYFVRDAAVTAS